MASLGISWVPVYQAYSIGIISSGDEIIPIEVAPRPGQVRDVNSYSLAAAVEEKGHKARIYPLVRDNAAELKAMVETSLAQNDITLMSGGSSVGIADLTLVSCYHLQVQSCFSWSGC